MTKSRQNRNSGKGQPAVANSDIETKKPVPRYLRYAVPALLLPAVIIYFWPLLTAQGYIWNDFIEQNFPYRLFASIWMKQGTFPFWNPYVFSGMPFFADIQTAVLYPFNILLVPFATKDWLSPLLFEYQIVAHYLLGGIFAYAFCRDLGISRLPAFFSSLVFMFSAFLPVHIFHVNCIHSATWFPLAALSMKRMLDRQSLLYCCIGAFALFMSCLAGYPQILMHTYYWLAAWQIFFVITALKRPESLKTILIGTGLFGLMIVLSAGMSAIQLLPTFELGNYSSRPSLSFSDSCEGSLRWYRLVTVLVPNFFGRHDSLYWGISASDVNSGVHYFWETAAYCGAATLVLAGIGLAFSKKPAVWFFGVVGMLALMLAMGDSFFLYGICFKLLPMFDKFRTPARFVFMFGVSAGICAAYGIHWLMQNSTGLSIIKKRNLERWMLGLIASALLAAVLVTAGGIKGLITEFIVQSQGGNSQSVGRVVDNEIYPYLVKWVWFAALMICATAGCVILRLRNHIESKKFAIACCLLVFTELVVFGYDFPAEEGGRNNPNKVFEATPVIKELQKQTRQEYFRINSRNSKPGTTDLGGRCMAFHKNQGSVHSLFLMEGYNPLRLKRQLADRHPKILDILNVKYVIQADEASRPLGFSVNTAMLPRARMVYDYLIEKDQEKILSVIKSDDFDHVRKVVLEQKPSFEMAASNDSVSGTAVIRKYSLNEIEIDVETPVPGLLVLSEIHYPAWKAWSEGVSLPVFRADYALRAIEVPAGSRRIICKFDSSSFKKGLWISMISWLIFLTIALRTFVMRKKCLEKQKGNGFVSV